MDEFRAEQAAARAAAGLPPSLGPGELMDGRAVNPQLDERNVRRRVYDALNVLMAMGIILKQKKEIIWKGLPETDVDETPMLQSQLERRAASVAAKRRVVRDLILQQLSFRRLVQRNKLAEAEARAQGLHMHESSGPKPLDYDEDGADGAAGGGGGHGGHDMDDGPPPPPGRPRSVIHLPFITLSTQDTATIQLDIDTPHRREARATFDEPFLVHDEKEILRQMRLHEFTEAELRRYVPDHLHRYVLQPLIEEDGGDEDGGGDGEHDGVGAGASSSSSSSSSAAATGKRSSAVFTPSKSGSSAGGSSAAAAAGASPGIIVGPDDAGGSPPLHLSPGLILPGNAPKEIVVQLSARAGNPSASMLSASLARGNIPLPGIAFGVDRSLLESALAGALKTGGGYLTDKGEAVASSPRMTAALAAVPSLPKEVGSWLGKLLLICASYLADDHAFQDVIAQQTAQRAAMATAHRAGMVRSSGGWGEESLTTARPTPIASPHSFPPPPPNPPPLFPRLADGAPGRVAAADERAEDCFGPGGRCRRLPCGADVVADGEYGPVRGAPGQAAGVSHRRADDARPPRGRAPGAGLAAAHGGRGRRGRWGGGRREGGQEGQGGRRGRSRGRSGGGCSGSSGGGGGGSSGRGRGRGVGGWRRRRRHGGERVRRGRCGGSGGGGSGTERAPARQEEQGRQEVVVSLERREGESGGSLIGLFACNG